MQRGAIPLTGALHWKDLRVEALLAPLHSYEAPHSYKTRASMRQRLVEKDDF